jgi:23S rRNA (uridine2552-2'-O)-methyltransferase
MAGDAALLMIGRRQGRVVLSGHGGECDASATGKPDHSGSRAPSSSRPISPREILTDGGAFLAKVFQGGTEHALLARLKSEFAVVRHLKPCASRADSAELYVLATGFRG